MEIKLNDKPFTIPEEATLGDALRAANAPSAGIATALNGTVVPACDRETTKLSNGDAVLIIKAFYGG